MPAVLWGTRIVLAGALAVHFSTAYQLWSRNKKATTGGRYHVKKFQESDYAARTMYWSGPILFFFIAFHLIHLTLGGAIWPEGAALLGIEGYAFDKHNPYNNMVNGFRHWPVVVPYVIGVVALGFHLFHGIYSMFQSLGLSHPKYNEYRKDLAIGLSIILVAGFLSLPMAALATAMSDSISWLEPSTQRFFFPELN